jgi:hypothetical protein
MKINKMKNQYIEQLKKMIDGLRKFRRRPPKETSPQELEAVSYSLDYLLEDLAKMNSKNYRRQF